MLLKPLLRGLSTFVPTLGRVLARGTGGTDSARYCYSVWMRHMMMAHGSGLNPIPETVAELGPGDSLGIGLAALISGCDAYVALDVVQYANLERNLAIFDGLVTLFRNRTAIPGEDEFPRVRPTLDSYGWPGDLLDGARLDKALEESRLNRIRESLTAYRSEDSRIHYVAPWYDAEVVRSESVDMIFSQAVLEHVDDLTGAYRAMFQWLKPHGYLSHQIDFKSHGTAREWNGHWAYSDLLWALIKGRRRYLLNREPHSTHLALLEREGFAIVCDKTVVSPSKLAKDDLAPRFRRISDADLMTSGAFVQAVKRSHG